MNTYYKFIPCNGVVPEGTFETKLHILYQGRPAMIEHDGMGWYFCNAMNIPVISTDWHHISILTPCEGVLMSREDVGKVWDAGYNRGEDQRNVITPEGNIYPDRETTINNLFSDNKTV